MARIFSNDTKGLLRDLQGLDRRINNLIKAAEEAKKYGVKPVSGIDSLQASGIKTKDIKALGFDTNTTRQMLSSAIQDARQQLASIDKKQVATMKKYTKIEKEFEPDKIITGHSPISGSAGHERYAAIMETLSAKDRAERRHGVEPGSMNKMGYDSSTFFDLYELAVEYGKTIPEIEEMVKNGKIEGLKFE